MTRTLLGLAVVLGCQVGGGDGPTEPPQPPIVPPSPQAPQPIEDDIQVRFHMYRNYDLSRAIERLLVRGQLDDARALARQMASLPEPPALEPWGKQVALVRARATAVADAGFLDEACRRAAQLAAACAQCHTDAGAVRLFDRPPPAAPPDQQTVESRMARHRWATDRLWEGMVGNAPQPWRAGLDVLAETPLPFKVIGTERVTTARRLQQLADQARQRSTTATLADRAQAYGEILETCTACHGIQPASNGSPTAAVLPR